MGIEIIKKRVDCYFLISYSYSKKCSENNVSINYNAVLLMFISTEPEAWIQCNSNTKTQGMGGKVESLPRYSVSQVQNHPGTPCWQHHLAVRFLHMESRIPRSCSRHSECISSHFSAEEQPVSSKGTVHGGKMFPTLIKSLLHIDDKVKKVHEHSFQEFRTS